MFQGCHELEYLDLSNFNTSNVTNMEYMFNNCYKLKNIKFSNKFNTIKVTSMERMFEACNELEYLNLSDFNTLNVTNMKYMFNECNLLNEIKSPNKFITDKVISTEGMFQGCSELKDLDLSSFDASNVKYKKFMFNKCDKLKNINSNVKPARKKENKSSITIEINIYQVKDKFKKNELSIIDVLMCNDCINDLKNNRRSIYKRILNLNNIKKLISYSLGLDDNNDDNLRYPYYSCELLCSPCILKFSKSIKHIIDAINFEKKINCPQENQETEFIENLKNENDEIFDYDEVSENVEEKKSELADFMNEEIYDFEKDKLIQSELQKSTMRTAENSNFEKEETNIINEILETIFSFLDSTLLECETYVGYFNKIINYLMINEPIITTKFIFENNKNIITKFSEHMNNDSIQNIFENLLNYLSDQEESNAGPSQFNSIIMNLFEDINNILKKDIKDDINLYYKDKNKIDFICELIINTLINNTSKNFIQLILPSTDGNDFMNFIKSLISDAVKPKFNENNHKKNVIINLIEVLGQINSIIMHSKKIVNNKLNEDMAFFNEHYKKIKTFEYQYFSRKTINYDDIFSAFDKNNKLNNSYISIIKDIYGLIINDIKNNYNNKNVKSLMFLYEWKYILSSLKLFIFQFYAFKNFDIIDGTNDFYDYY